MRHRSTRLRTAAAALIVACAGAASMVLAAPGVPEIRTLDNGLPVVIVEDHTLPLVAASLWIHSGSKDEIDTSAGYTHFLEHLVQAGTDTSGPFEYQRLAHRWGGTLAVHANYDRLSITVTGASSALDQIVDAAAGMALRAKLDDKQIDAELGTLSQEMRNYYDEPASVAFLESMRTAFPKHPYRFPPLGNTKTIGSLKHDPLTAFYKNLFAPNNMALAVAGDLDPVRARELIEKSFGKAAASATLPPKPAPLEGFAGHDDKEKLLDLKDSWATLTFVGPGYRHPDRPAFEVLVKALGEAGGSPIARALLRDKVGSSAQVLYYRLEDAGLLYIGMPVAQSEMGYPAAAAALAEVASLKKRGFKDADAKQLVQRVIREERLRAERLETMSDGLAEAVLFGGARYYWDLPTVYDRLSAADLNRVAAKYLVGENLRLVMIAPKASKPSTEERKARFHEALDTLGGVPKDAPNPGFGDRLYNSEEAARLQSDAWGDPRDARAVRPAVSTTLDNGLRLVTREDHRRALVGVSLQLRFGSGDDPPGKEGLAYVAAHLLSPGFKPVAKSEGKQKEEKTVLLPEIQVSQDLTEWSFLSTPDDLRTGLSALAAAVQRPGYEPGALETVRKLTKETLARAESDPSTETLALFREKVYSGHPYAHSIYGTNGGLASLSRQDVDSFLGNVLRPGGAVLAIVGDLKPEEIQKTVANLFDGWKGGSTKPADKSSATSKKDPAAARATPGEYTRVMSASQSSVLVGIPGAAIGDPDFNDLRVLGAGLTVLSFEDLVFKRRAAFSATVIPEALRDGGSLAVVVGTQHLRRDEAVFDVQRLMRRLAFEDLDQKDVDDFARMEAAREAGATQGVLATASVLAYRQAVGLDLSPPVIPAPGTLSTKRLKEVAGRFLKPESWIVVKIGPPSH